MKFSPGRTCWSMANSILVTCAPAKSDGLLGAALQQLSGLEVESLVFEVDSDGLLGAQIDTQNINIAMRDGTRPRTAIRQSDCLRQFHGKWQTFLEALSYAVDKKSGQAIMPSSIVK